MLERNEDSYPHEKTIIMPSLETMKKRIDTIHLPLRHGVVFDRFIHSIANQNHRGTTLVIAWEQACEDGLKRFPMKVDLAITNLLHTYAFPRVIDAIVPDPEVATDAKE